MDQNNYTLFLGVGVVVLVLYFLSSIAKPSKKNRVPEIAGAWPIVGHANLFGGSSDPPHIAFRSMALKYGPMFTIRRGVRRILIVNSLEIAKEIFTTHDAIVSSPAKTTGRKIFGYNDYAMPGAAPYGPYWRELRKIMSLELLSSRRVEELKHIRVYELESSIKNLYEQCGEGKVLVDIEKWFGELDMNVVLRMVVGKRYSGGEQDDLNRLEKALTEFFDYLGILVVADTIPVPFLGWLDLGGHVKAMKRVVEEFDCVIGKWLDEHRMNKGSVGEKDFMDVLISATETGIFAHYDADAVIKATCVDIIAGSKDMTAMLTCSLSLLLNNPHALKKVQDEIDTHVGKDKQVDDSDIKKLIYLQAVVKETLRLHPVTPLGPTRQFAKDCIVAGYHVPKGTWLRVNKWSLHQDPEIWPEPAEFRPERFLGGSHVHADVRGRNIELIPFGAGRRRCAGIHLSLQMLHTVLATLLHNFHIYTPDAKATPLEIQITPRAASIKEVIYK